MNSVDRFLDNAFQIVKAEWANQERFDKLKALHEKIDSKATDEQIWNSVREKLVLDVVQSLLNRNANLLTYSDFLEISKLNVDSLKVYYSLRITGQLR